MIELPKIELPKHYRWTRTTTRTGDKYCVEDSRPEILCAGRWRAVTDEEFEEFKQGLKNAEEMGLG